MAALPATANDKPASGTRIGLFAPPATFAANTPFYIEQGFACGLGDGSRIASLIGADATAFSLYVDGVLQPSTVDVDVANGSITKLYLTNFEAGLPAGTHTFVGVFFFER